MAFRLYRRKINNNNNNISKGYLRIKSIFRKFVLLLLLVGRIVGPTTLFVEQACRPCYPQAWAVLSPDPLSSLPGTLGMPPGNSISLQTPETPDSLDVDLPALTHQQRGDGSVAPARMLSCKIVHSLD